MDSPRWILLLKVVIFCLFVVGNSTFVPIPLTMVIIGRAGTGKTFVTNTLTAALAERTIMDGRDSSCSVTPNHLKVCSKKMCVIDTRGFGCVGSSPSSIELVVEGKAYPLVGNSKSILNVLMALKSSPFHLLSVVKACGSISDFRVDGFFSGTLAIIKEILGFVWDDIPKSLHFNQCGDRKCEACRKHYSESSQIYEELLGPHTVIYTIGKEHFKPYCPECVDKAHLISSYDRILTNISEPVHVELKDDWKHKLIQSDLSSLARMIKNDGYCKGLHLILARLHREFESSFRKLLTSRNSHGCPEQKDCRDTTRHRKCRRCGFLLLDDCCETRTQTKVDHECMGRERYQHEMCVKKHHQMVDSKISKLETEHRTKVQDEENKFDKRCKVFAEFRKRMRKQ